MAKKRTLKFYAENLFKGGAALTLSEFSTKFIGFLLLPILTVYLSPKDYGILSIFMMVQSILNLFYNPGVLDATQRLYYGTKDKSRRQELVGSSFVFFLTLPLSIAFISFLFGEQIFSTFFNDFPFLPYGLMALIFSVFSQPIKTWRFLLMSHYRTNKLALVTFSKYLLSVLLALLFIIGLKMGAMGRIIGMMIGGVALFTVSFIDVIKFTKKFSFRTIKEILQLGSPLIFATWSYFLLKIGDRYILERLTNMDIVGIYSLGYKIASIPLLLTAGLRHVWRPIFFENMQNEKHKNISKLSTYFVFVIITFVSVTILFSQEVFTLLINQRYISGLKIIPWVSSGSLFLVFLTIFNPILEYEKKYGRIAIYASIAAVLNIVLNIIFIPKFGMMGAAVSTFVCYLIYLVQVIFSTKKYIAILFEVKDSLIILIFFGLSVVLHYLLRSTEFNLLYFLIRVTFVISWIAISIYTDLLPRKGLKYIFKIIKRKGKQIKDAVYNSKK
mgnify:CR=1 FL=1